jgi:hypothetical protein
MAWFEDLSPWPSAGPEHAACLRAVGWLSPARPFALGNVDTAFYRRLCELAQDPWAPWVSGGAHSCEFCRFTGGGHASYNGLGVPARSARELFVPGEGVLYVSPVSITHYIDAHGYGPPEEYRRAVLACPPMRSGEYLRRILANGGRRLAVAGRAGVPLP